MEKPKFVYVTLIATTPEKLWAALTDPVFTKQYFFGTAIESDWKVGSRFVFNRDGRISDEGIVLKSEPPRLLSFTFQHLLDEVARAEKPSRVTYEIEPLTAGVITGDAVRLTVTHDEFEPESTVFPKISNGWPSILSNLKTLLETGKVLNLVKNV